MILSLIMVDRRIPLSIYKAHFWNEKDRSRMLINSMAAHKHFWKIPVDLKPSNSQLRSFDEKVTAIFKDK